MDVTREADIAPFKPWPISSVEGFLGGLDVARARGAREQHTWLTAYRRPEATGAAARSTSPTATAICSATSRAPGPRAARRATRFDPVPDPLDDIACPTSFGDYSEPRS